MKRVELSLSLATNCYECQQIQSIVNVELLLAATADASKKIAGAELFEGEGQQRGGRGIRFFYPLGFLLISVF